MLDVFNSDAFSVVRLTAAINKMPRKPGRIAAMGLFREQGIDTTRVAISESEGVLALIPTSTRGGPGTTIGTRARKIRDLRTLHIKLTSNLLAEEVQNVRAMEGEDQLMPYARKMNDRLEDLNNSVDATIEYHMIGALMGQVRDADDARTVLYDLPTEFGVTAFDPVDFVLGTDSTDVAGICREVSRKTEKCVGNMPISRLHALCGPTFFDKFVKHPEVKDAYRYVEQNSFARTDQRKGFEFQGIFFEEYNVQVGGVPFIPPADVRFFPVGPDIYQIRNAPADYIETVNTIGVPRYAKQERMKMDRGIEVEVQANPLVFCTHPRALIRGFSSN